MLKGIISVFMSLLIFISSFMLNLFEPNNSLRIVVPENWEMDVGDSRTLECVFSEDVTNRVISWSTSPESVATVDKWGRVTAKSVGKATVTAKVGSIADSVELNVVKTPTKTTVHKEIVNYQKKGIEEVDNLQKVVTKHANGSKQIPSYVYSVTDYSKYQKVTTADGATWEITDYGVLRTDKNAPTERDKEQRFMGDRYFYSADTTDGKVLAIIPDGKNGIWTIMKSGVSHIEMLEMSGTDKAAQMSADTQEYVNRLGFASDAYLSGGKWRGTQSDNDGLWTSMYGAGEIMRYATLKNDSTATAEEIEEARKTAVQSAEAMLMLHYVSMRTGTTEAYVRRQENGNIPGNVEDRWLSADALKAGGNYSISNLSESSADYFKKSLSSYLFTGSSKLIANTERNQALYPNDWSNPASTENSQTVYAKRTRLLEGFVSRSYSFESDKFHKNDNIYWQVNNDKTATGVSNKSPSTSGYLLNNENLRGYVVDASGEIPERLWDNLIGDSYDLEDLIYKGDTSADELIGHMFIFKIMYDVLAPEDPELKELIVKAIDNLAQHLVDNGYMLFEASGHPSTWSNFSRTLFTSSSSIGAAPLHAMVVLSIFKTAAYITGYQKWEDEYRMAALDPAYEYAEVASQYYERVVASISYVIGESVSPALALPIKLLSHTKLVKTVSRVVINYSDEEMAMLAFYVLFQLEDDNEILSYYRNALNDWWISIQYSENPLWYYIYQLAYPNKTIKDAYGNNILETAAWSLNRSPINTVRYLASNKSRDDIAILDLTSLGVKIGDCLSYSIDGLDEPVILKENASIGELISFVFSVIKLDWCVAAPDERAYHKYNVNSYALDIYHETNHMEASTVYTLPYWMGRYHSMLETTS